jgi:PTH1 family peptidyl-tRNA hydrolase
MTTEPLAFIGLGNPGPEYALTRHNIGFMAIDHLISSHNFTALKKEKRIVEHGRYSLNGAQIILAKPSTFMNLSGQAIAWVAQFYKIPAENIWVLYDDVALPFGQIRIRKNGSAGGHNGMKSIISVLGPDFPRLRFGILPDHPVSDLSNYVLGRFTKPELKTLDPVIDKIPEIVETLLSVGIDQAMNKFN